MITTEPDNKWPLISWEIGDELDHDSEHRMVIFHAFGKDKNGNSYTGSAYFYAGEFEEIQDIERL